MGRRAPDPSFPAFPAIPRLHRDVVITEKIDGTNGVIQVLPAGHEDAVRHPGDITVAQDDGYVIRAGARSRWVHSGEDNFGFAAWVAENAAFLLEDLGVGTHYGEWWGSDINRGYGLPKGEKRFSLFNTSRWTTEVAKEFLTPHLGAVPILARGPGQGINLTVNNLITYLRETGSKAAPGFMRPEGVIIYHTAGNLYFKATVEKDELPKSLVGVA